MQVPPTRGILPLLAGSTLVFHLGCAARAAALRGRDDDNADASAAGYLDDRDDDDDAAYVAAALVGATAQRVADAGGWLLPRGALAVRARWTPWAAIVNAAAAGGGDAGGDDDAAAGPSGATASVSWVRLALAALAPGGGAGGAALALVAIQVPKVRVLR